MAAMKPCVGGRSILALGILTLAACKEPAPAPAPPPSASASAHRAEAFPTPAEGFNSMFLDAPQDAAASPAPVAVAPALKLANPGSEPRRAVRYAFAAGVSRDVTASFRGTVREEGPGGRSSQQPSYRLTLQVTAAQPGPEGTPFTFAVRKADLGAGGATLTDEERRNVKALLDALTLVHGSFHVTPSGSNSQLALDVRGAVPKEIEAVLPSLVQAVELLVVPWPTEPIGVGASWAQVSTGVGEGADGLKGALTARFELKALTATGATVEVTTDRKAPRQTPAGAPPGAFVQVDAKGTYTMTTPFTGVVTKVIGAMETKLALEEGTHRQLSVTTIQTTLESK